MTEGTPLSEKNPHVVRKGAEETGGEFVQFESTMYPAQDADGTGTHLPHERWGLDNDFEHVHPEQEEWWEVRTGKLRVAFDGDERTLTEGDDITLPAGVPHRHWNPTNEPIRVVWERRPAFRTEEWAESVFALAQAGKTDDDGVPDVLQSVVILDKYSTENPYFASVSIGVQKAAASLLSPLGRLAGYRATHSRSDLNDYL
ncbi:cupin domain-containing protein [Halobacteriales archaeon QH_2_65_14]|nr:MAG: cupin domain-containing protein [Halobacteriales archaeon QH_2_65_14]